VPLRVVRFPSIACSGRVCENIKPAFPPLSLWTRPKCGPNPSRYGRCWEELKPIGPKGLLTASHLHCTAGSSRSFTAIRKDAGLYCGSRLRKGEVFAYVGRIHNLKDLQEEKKARRPFSVLSARCPRNHSGTPSIELPKMVWPELVLVMVCRVAK